MAGSVLMMLGLLLLSLSMLRALEEETGSAFTGNLSWLPHAITLVAVVAVTGGLVALIAKGTRTL